MIYNIYSYPQKNQSSTHFPPLFFVCFFNSSYSTYHGPVEDSPTEPTNVVLVLGASNVRCWKMIGRRQGRKMKEVCNIES